MLKWWKKGKKRNKWEKRGENEKNVNIMLKWWNKRIKCEKMPKWWKKGKKRNKWEKRGKNE